MVIVGTVVYESAILVKDIKIDLVLLEREVNEISFRPEQSIIRVPRVHIPKPSSFANNIHKNTV